MSEAENAPRIRRRETPPAMTGRYGYVAARPHLRRDFDCRCAYCMIHEQEANGPEAFEVDHFHPSSKGGPINDYENLYWSCVPCNRFKGDQWPEPAQRERGVRFADPCREQDYGLHVAEGSDGVLVALTTCGQYHIAALRLNRPRLCRLRQQRTAKRLRIAEALDLLTDAEELLSGSGGPDSAAKRRLLSFLRGELETLQAEVGVAIPEMPAA